MNKQSNQRNISLVLFSILVYAAIIAVLGLFQVFVFETDISEIRTIQFWLELGVKSAMFFAAYVATAIIRYTWLEVKNREYVELEDSIKKHRPKLIGKRFRTYISVIDFENKIDTWKNKYNTKLENHSRRVPKKVALQLTNLEESEWNWKTRRYKRKENKFITYLSNEWIQKNLRWRRLKYPELTVSEVINGTMKYKTRGSMIERNHLSKQVLKKTTLVIFSIIASAIWSILVFKEILNPMEIIALIVFTLAMLLVNVLTGWLAGGKGHKSRIIATTERLEVILNYIDLPVSPTTTIKEDITI